MFGAINDKRQIPGYAGFGVGPYGAPLSYTNFLYTNGVFTPFDTTGLPGTVLAINDNGVIIGNTYDFTVRVDYDATHYYLGAEVGYIATPIPDSVSPVPEPSTLGLLGLPLAGAVLRRKPTRRRVA